MEIKPFPVDTTIGATNEKCRTARIDGCCRLAVERSIQELGDGQHVAEAVIKFMCVGPNEDGCQARVTGHLLDENKFPLLAIDTTATELIALAKANPDS